MLESSKAKHYFIKCLEITAIEGGGLYSSSRKRMGTVTREILQRGESAPFLLKEKSKNQSKYPKKFPRRECESLRFLKWAEHSFRILGKKGQSYIRKHGKKGVISNSTKVQNGRGGCLTR